MKIQTESNEIVVHIDYASLLENKEVLRDLIKYHAYSNMLLTCLVQMATTGQVDWGIYADDDNVPWQSYWSGPGEPFEKLRLAITSCVNDTTRKLIDDLKNERDRLQKEKDEFQRSNWQKDRRIDDLRRRLEPDFIDSFPSAK